MFQPHEYKTATIAEGEIASEAHIQSRDGWEYVDGWPAGMNQSRQPILTCLFRRLLPPPAPPQPEPEQVWLQVPR